MINYGFDEHVKVGKEKKTFKGHIFGWVASKNGSGTIEVGPGSLYNSHWRWGNVLSLNGGKAKKTDVYQSYFFDAKFEHVAADQV